MDTALLIILIVIGNLALYWVFFGKKKFEQKHGLNQQSQTIQKTDQDLNKLQNKKN
tara:strand:+ start:531 stop:698 length:168 start_codon:yes stop_codon:yes gene_type:complete